MPTLGTESLGPDAELTPITEPYAGIVAQRSELELTPITEPYDGFVSQRSEPEPTPITEPYAGFGTAEVLPSFADLDDYAGPREGW